MQMCKKTYKQFSKAAFVLWSLLAHNLCANTFTVTTTNVAGPGSLAAAILQANQTPGSNVINITVTNAITQSVMLPVITKSVSIIGTANTAAIISGGGTQPIFIFSSDTTNSLANLILKNGFLANVGSSAGSAINNSGTLFVNNCVFTNNQSTNSFGGAIFNGGRMTIVSSLIVGNNAQLGGGIYSTGDLVIAQSTLIKNTAFGGNGAPGYSQGGGGGGGMGGSLLAYSGIVHITNSTFVNNRTYGGNPGISSGIYWGGGSGGGVNGGSGGGATVQYYPPAYGVGYGSAGGFGGGGGGAGVNSSVNISGGLGGFGGGAAGSGGSGFGGAILVNTDVIIDIVNSTIISNNCYGSGTGLGLGGGIYNNFGKVTILNTIIAGNITTTSSPDLIGSFNSLGNNLIGNNEGTSGLSLLDFQNVSANLGPLQNNGGPTPTCAELPDSPSILGGTGTGAPLFDQRGISRPPDAVDIGAFQFTTNVLSPVFFTNPNSVTNNYGLSAYLSFSCGNTNLQPDCNPYEFIWHFSSQESRGFEG